MLAAGAGISALDILCHHSGFYQLEPVGCPKVSVVFARLTGEYLIMISRESLPEFPRNFFSNIKALCTDRRPNAY